VIREAPPEAVAVPRARLGEGPCWDPRTALLYWTDIPAGRIHRYDPVDGSHAVTEVGQPVGAMAPRSAGGLVVAVRDGFGFCDPEAGTFELVGRVDADRPGNRMNDGKCDPDGRFFAGTKAEDDTPGAAALYRLDPDLAVTRVVDDLTISNGLDWSADGRLFYFVDSPTRRIDLFDRDPATGAISGRRPFVELPADAGWPDGLTVDAEGCVWVALWGGSAVRRYRPDGRLDRVLRLPARLVTSCAFGGPDLDVLYVTTAAPDPGSSVPVGPGDGSLFACRVGVVGRPVHAFAG